MAAGVETLCVGGEAQDQVEILFDDGRVTGEHRLQPGRREVGGGEVVERHVVLHHRSELSVRAHRGLQRVERQAELGGEGRGLEHAHERDVALKIDAELQSAGLAQLAGEHADVAARVEQGSELFDLGRVSAEEKGGLSDARGGGTTRDGRLHYGHAMDLGFGVGPDGSSPGNTVL